MFDTANNRFLNLEIEKNYDLVGPLRNLELAIGQESGYDIKFPGDPVLNIIIKRVSETSYQASTTDNDTFKQGVGKDIASAVGLLVMDLDAVDKYMNSLRK